MVLLKYSLSILVIFNVTILINAHPLTASIPKEFNAENLPQLSWLQHMRILRHLIKECENSTSANTWQCLKVTSLNVIDNVTRRGIIPLWPGVRFVARPDVKEIEESPKMNQNDFWHRADLQYLTWFDRLVLILTKMIKTHMMEINLKELTEAYMDNVERKDLSHSNKTDPIGTARLRRHRFNMMITMMFGVTAFGAVLVPMGFQMLSIVSGKALLLAKMALLLASINGLKRVANTGVHYGLYHVPGEHYGHYYDRGDVHHPRNVQHLTPLGQPVAVDLDV